MTGASGYAIEREGGPGGGNWSIIGGTGAGWATGYNDDSAAADQSYTYEVVAYDNTDRSDPSSTTEVTTPAVAPQFGSLLNAQPLSDNSVFLSWSGQFDAAATTFSIVRYDITHGGTQTLATGLTASTTDFTDNTAATDTNYTYELFASIGPTITPATDAANVTTLDNIASADNGSAGSLYLTLAFNGLNANADNSADGLAQPAWYEVTRGRKTGRVQGAENGTRPIT